MTDTSSQRCGSGEAEGRHFKFHGPRDNLHEHIDTAPARPSLTLSEAAEATGTHRNTIRRRLDRGEFPIKYREDERGSWLIPVEDLRAAGFRLDDADELATLGLDVDELSSLRAENAELRRRAEVAEARAEERGRALELADRALRASESRLPE